jgi:hypothetical protein
VFSRIWRKRPAREVNLEEESGGTAIEREPRDWTDELSDEERDRVIENVARGAVDRGMATPAILFLEMHKPVSFFASQGLVMFSPFTAPFIGMDNVQVASKLIEKRENVELLIRRIEELSTERDAEEHARRQAARAAKRNGQEARDS